MKQLRFFFLILSLFFGSVAYGKVVTLSVEHPNAKYGVFSTYNLKVKPLNDKYHRVKLLEELVFIDAHGKKWVAPKGYIVDGATIPKPLQSIIGTPYGGAYVLASVIHDVACVEKKEPWQEVHQAFYDAMLASGVDERKASAMYIAVYEVAPRWGKNRKGHLSEKELLKLFGVDDSLKKELKEMGSLFGEMIQNLNIEVQESERGVVLRIGGISK